MVKEMEGKRIYNIWKEKKDKEWDEKYKNKNKDKNKDKKQN